jgi:hypothetical protein
VTAIRFEEEGFDAHEQGIPAPLPADGVSVAAPVSARWLRHDDGRIARRV